MSITVEWLNAEQTAIIQKIRVPFTWDEFHATDKVIKSMIASVSHPVSILVDLQEFSIHIIPNGILTHIHMTIRSFPDNLQQVIVIADNLFITSLLKTVQQLGMPGPDLKLHAVRSMGEAQTHLDSIPR